MKWTVNDLKAVVKLEKNKDDGKMPTTKRGIVDLYAKCMARKGQEVVIEAPGGSVAQIAVTGTDVATVIENDNTKTAI
jgi:hypothetical protein